MRERKVKENQKQQESREECDGRRKRRPLPLNLRARKKRTMSICAYPMRDKCLLLRGMNSVFLAT
jgi:hypothetical protein